MPASPCHTAVGHRHRIDVTRGKALLEGKSWRLLSGRSQGSDVPGPGPPILWTQTHACHANFRGSSALRTCPRADLSRGQWRLCAVRETKSRRATETPFSDGASPLLRLNCRRSKFQEGFSAPWGGLCLTDASADECLCSGAEAGEEDAEGEFPQQGSGRGHLRLAQPRARPQHGAQPPRFRNAATSNVVPRSSLS